MHRPTIRTLKAQRSELIVIVAGIIVWAIVVSLLTVRLAGLDAEYPGCFGLLTVGADCQAGQSVFAGWDQFAEAVQWLSLVIPVFLGVFLGVPIVAREVETGVAQISWALARTRHRWLGVQVLPVSAVLILLLVIIAAGGELLTVARLGGDDPGFQHHDQRGVLVVVRGILAFGLGLLVGTLLGRVLPAILLGLALSAVMIGGTTLALDQWRQQDADLVRVEAVGPGTPYVNGMMLGPAAVLPDGTVTRERNVDKIPLDADLGWVLVIPVGAYPTWIAREAAITLGATAIAFITTIVILRHRRPR